jgi:isoamylase
MKCFLSANTPHKLATIAGHQNLQKMEDKLSHGKSFPLGSVITNDGVNFSVFSKHATGMELLLFSSADAAQPKQVIQLDAVKNRTYNFWHVFVPGITSGQVYGLRAQGPFEPEQGLRFDGKKLLLDPYTKAVVGWKKYDRAAALSTGDNCGQALRSVVVDNSGYDWEGDTPLRIPYSESVIYELHVGGFTRHGNSGVSADRRGTFAGLIEKIPYLKDLGVTAVELMPVQEFDVQDARAGLVNYWGYSTLAFLAPHHGYCVNSDASAGINEFRDMVKALHKAGIEVILDVVFNHTAEGNEEGPTQCFRGLDNPVYYILDPSNQSRYANFSGCGNSFNADHPIVGRLILDCLRYWVSEMHVDGFRFDLAASLVRDVLGEPLSRPPLLWAIESDPVLAGTKLIAEAWDAAGLSRVGWFINVSQWYAEWNGHFRDDVRRFVKGDRNTVYLTANRITGSSDIYTKHDREPNRSINFLTCHDGFTLYDLVSYDSKHNEANGENNRDGYLSNLSWNCGAEGPTGDPHIEALRFRQMKNMLTILFVSQGTPMILMGDEAGRTQHGNNNAYCHNSELSWLDWNLLERHSDLHRFVKRLIAFTQSLELFRQRNTIAISYTSEKPHVVWHGVALGLPDWSENSHSLAFSLEHPSVGERLHIMLNAYWEPLLFELPAPDGGKSWRRIIDTSLATPLDIASGTDAFEVTSDRYAIEPRSVAVLMAL